MYFLWQGVFHISGQRQTDTLQHNTLAGQNFGGFGTVRKLVEKFLAVGHTNNSYLTIRAHNI